jgi:stage IV sporulation protein FB
VRYGIPVADITLYPIGGIARIEKLPEPKQELWIAVAGPVVNVVIAGALALYLSVSGQFHTAAPTLAEGANWAEKVLGANVALALFNLIPAFPMDGGRILRALLAMRMPLDRATAVAATVGQTLAIVGGLTGIVTGQWTLVLIAFVIYVGAGQEVMVVRRESLVKNVTVREAMLSDVHTLPQGATYRQAADLLLATSQQDFPIVLGDQVYGLLSRDALLRGLASEGADAYIASRMDREFARARPDDDLQGLLQEMQDGTGPALVFEGDRMVGMVTTENLMEFLLIRQITARRPEEAVG